MDLLSYRDTPLHRLDPRAKFIVTLVFLICLVSFHKYQLSNLIPYFIFPVYLVSAGDIPGRHILKKILAVSPFAFMMAVFNPVFDTNVVGHIGIWSVTGGWISFCSIMLRFVLTVGTVFCLIACTGFHALCNAMGRLGMPRGLVVQLLFLYRYIFVLVEEAARMMRARDLRSLAGKGQGLASYGPLAGTLLLRSIGRAQKIHRAMLCRGFDGEIRLSREYSFGAREYVFIVQWCALFIIFRLWNVSHLAGDIIVRFSK
jgi:cobalt/nickel transport system permease protein